MQFHNVAQEKAYQHAMKRQYKAIAFDIDGTLTPFGRWIIPESLRDTLLSIPQNIPLALCTGRPLDYIKRQLKHICESGANPEREMQRWFVLSENGGAGFHFNLKKKDFDSFFKLEWPSAQLTKETLEAFIKDKFGWHVVFIVREHSVVIRFHTWIYLFPRITRFLSRRVAGELRTLLKSMGQDKNFSVEDSGIGNLIIPAKSGKGKAVKLWAKHLGISTKDILVIGDQPNIGQNDEEFLSGLFGTSFTVGALSKNTFPLPVLDHRGRHLKGPEGTERLLKRLF